MSGHDLVPQFCPKCDYEKTSKDKPHLEKTLFELQKKIFDDKEFTTDDYTKFYHTLSIYSKRTVLKILKNNKRFCTAEQVTQYAHDIATNLIERFLQEPEECRVHSSFGGWMYFLALAYFSKKYKDDDIVSIDQMTPSQLSYVAYDTDDYKTQKKVLDQIFDLSVHATNLTCLQITILIRLYFEISQIGIYPYKRVTKSKNEVIMNDFAMHHPDAINIYHDLVSHLDL